MTLLRKAYPWNYRNKTGSTLAPFESFRITGYQDEPTRGIVLEGDDHENEATEATGINGPTEVAPNDLGSCSAPGVFWAKTSSATDHNDTMGGVAGKATLDINGEGFQQIGDKDPKKGALVFRPGGGGGGGIRHGMLIKTIEAATMSGTAKTMDPGTADSAVIVLKRTTAGTSWEEDPDKGTIAGENGSATDLRGSIEDPVIVYGTIENIEGKDTFVCMPHDLRLQPGYRLDTSPQPAQALRHLDGNPAIEFGGAEC